MKGLCRRWRHGISVPCCSSQQGIQELHRTCHSLSAVVWTDVVSITELLRDHPEASCWQTAIVRSAGARLCETGWQMHSTYALLQLAVSAAC